MIASHLKAAELACGLGVELTTVAIYLDLMVDPVLDLPGNRR